MYIINFELEKNNMEKSLKKKRSKDEILEIVVVILLGLTAFLTAWATWIGSLHGGNQATNYAKSSNISADGNSRWNQAAQDLTTDMQLWNTISEMRIQYAFAEQKGDTEEMERTEWTLNQIYMDNVSEDLQKAIDWADKQKDYASPFDMDGFVESYFADAQTVLDEAQATLEQGQQDNIHGDAFGLVTVIYSIVLFMLGIAGSFKSTSNKMVIIGIGVVGLLAASIYMMTLPLPTGFSIFSYFSK